jgi:hypothetical protein
MSINALKAGWLWDDLRLASERVKMFDKRNAERSNPPVAATPAHEANGGLAQADVAPSGQTIHSDPTKHVA